jgi:hypothetical protein
MLRMKKSSSQTLTTAQKLEIQQAKAKYHPFLGSLLF